MTRVRGITPINYVKPMYCPKCNLWGYFERCKMQLPPNYIFSVKHTETIAGYTFTVSRCYFYMDKKK